MTIHTYHLTERQMTLYHQTCRGRRIFGHIDGSFYPGLWEGMLALSSDNPEMGIELTDVDIAYCALDGSPTDPQFTLSRVSASQGPEGERPCVVYRVSCWFPDVWGDCYQVHFDAPDDAMAVLVAAQIETVLNVTFENDSKSFQS